MPVAASSPTVHATTVLDRREPGPGIVILELDAPLLANSALPGQYVMAIPPSGESVATALGIYEAEGERISLMIVTVGQRTAELAALRTGAALSMLGPLGNGFDVPALGSDVAIIAGGVGLASLLMPAERIVRSGGRAHLYYGARTSAALVDVAKFERLGIEASLATDDGSLGYHGYVTDLFVHAGRAHSGIAACGPLPMLRSVGRLAAHTRAQLSLEETFACGVGACWGCIVPIDPASAQAPKFPLAARGGGPGAATDFVNARVCTEGPVFWAHDLRW